MFKKMNYRFVLIAAVILALAFFFLPKNLFNDSEISPSPSAIKIITNPATINSAETTSALSTINSDEVQRTRLDMKAILAFSFTGQKTFFSQHHRYTTDLKAVGILPSESLIKYKFGFLKEFYPDKLISNSTLREDARRKDSDFFIGKSSEENPSAKYQYSKDVQGMNLKQYQQYCKAGCTASDKDFEMILAAPLSGNHNVDIWLINQENEITLIKDGLKE